MMLAATRQKLLTHLFVFVWMGLAFCLAKGQCDCNSVPLKTLQDAARGGPAPRGMRVDSENDLEQLYAFPELMFLDIDLRHATRLDLDLARFPGLQCLRLYAPKLELLPSQLKQLEMLCNFKFYSERKVSGWTDIFKG
jgi:hypothetical protein